MTEKEKFLSRTITKENGCVEWLGCLRGKTGYGAMKFRGKVWDTHRIAYTLFKEEIPQGLCVLHKCDNRKCVNPDHLFLGTLKDNFNDAIKKGRPMACLLNKLPERRELARCKSLGNRCGCKYSEELILSIKKDISIGLKSCKICEKYGVNKYLVHRVRSGKNWKWLT